jgi:hypothetical protein
MIGPASVLFDINGNPLATLPDGSLLVTIADGYVTANFPAVQIVSVNNLPAVQTVSVNNLPVTQPVSGTVSVSNFPAFPATQPVSGTVSISNLPATQPVSGTVSVSNFPAFPATQPVSGTISISNFPATQPISGSVTLLGTSTVTVSNFPAFPAIQPVSQSGTWSVSTNKCSTSVVTAVASSTTSVVLLAANAARIFAHISNALPNKTLYVKLGAGASLTSFTDVVLTGDAYDIPNDYIGIVSGIWASGVNTLNSLCTELSP